MPSRTTAAPPAPIPQVRARFSIDLAANRSGAQRIAKQMDTIETEEATKNAFIMPFLSALAYDVFDPHVVARNSRLTWA